MRCGHPACGNAGKALDGDGGIPAGGRPIGTAFVGGRPAGGNPLGGVVGATGMSMDCMMALAISSSPPPRW